MGILKGIYTNINDPHDKSVGVCCPRCKTTVRYYTLKEEE
jgi:hypothetical protein